MGAADGRRRRVTGAPGHRWEGWPDGLVRRAVGATEPTGRGTAGTAPTDRRDGGSEVDARVAAAERAVRALNRGAHQDPGLISRFLLRSEAIASSSIEGIAPGPKNVALAELALDEDVRGHSETAQQVARNMTIVRDASDALSEKEHLSVADLEALQSSLIPGPPEMQGVRTAAEQAAQLERSLAALREEWAQAVSEARRREGKVRATRRDSALPTILDTLPGTPVLTTSTVVRVHGVTTTAAHDALAQLSEYGILGLISIGRAQRAFVSLAVLDLITRSGRAVASRDFDTSSSPPIRPAPAPRRPVGPDLPPQEVPPSTPRRCPPV